MALNKTITLANTDVSTVYIDATRVETVKSQVKTDLKNIINDIQNIQKAYSTLAKHPKTQGDYRSTANACVTKCKKYRSNLSTVRTSLENKIDNAVISYVLSMLAELQKAQNAANSISESAE